MNLMRHAREIASRLEKAGMHVYWSTPGDRETRGKAYVILDSTTSLNSYRASGDAGSDQYGLTSIRCCGGTERQARWAAQKVQEVILSGPAWLYSRGMQLGPLFRANDVPADVRYSLTVQVKGD